MTAEVPVTITAYPDGPLIVHGEVIVRDLDGAPLDTGTVTALCRCGRSARKPLCDGSHRRGRPAAHRGGVPPVNGSFRVEIDPTIPAVQGDEYFVVDIGGDRRTINIHDYNSIFAVPGLYEHVLQLRLQSRSPQMMASSLSARVAACDEAGREVRCLDVGAGNGVAGAALSVAGLIPVVGIDISPAAGAAAERDRPGLYAHYVIGALGEIALGPLIDSYRLNALVSSAALTGGHIEPDVLAETWAAFAPGDWLAFTCLDKRADQARAGFEAWTDFEVDERYLHRVLTTGEPVHFRVFVGRRRETARS